MEKKDHNVSEEEIRRIKAVSDEAAIRLAKEADGVSPYYHTIGTMGGLAVRDKYKSVESMANSKKE